MARETEHRDLDSDVVAAGVAALFDEPSRGGYHVAERDGEIVGSLMLTREWSDWRNGEFWWIQSVYVVPEARRQGVFRALYDDVLERARETDGVCGVRLYVEKENGPALEVYDAVGMSRTSYRLYEVDFVLGS
jgi:ribosomal protein S18 acetylase RimI-like enzyme